MALVTTGWKNLLIDDQDGIVTVTINRPKAMNAISSPAPATRHSSRGRTSRKWPSWIPAPGGTGRFSAKR